MNIENVIKSFFEKKQAKGNNIVSEKINGSWSLTSYDLVIAFWKDDEIRIINETYLTKRIKNHIIELKQQVLANSKRAAISGHKTTNEIYRLIANNKQTDLGDIINLVTEYETAKKENHHIMMNPVSLVGVELKKLLQKRLKADQFLFPTAVEEITKIKKDVSPFINGEILTEDNVFYFYSDDEV